MAITTEHKQYAEASPLWRDVRAALKGERYIKSQREIYLPMPPALELARKRGGDDAEFAKVAYEDLLRNARFPDITRDALSGIIGLTLIKKPKTEMLDEVVSNKKEKLPVFAGALLRESAVTGRAIVVVDIPTGGGDAYMTIYGAEELINWREDKDGNLTLAVIRETSDESVDGDGYETDEVTRYRRYELLPGGAVSLSIRDGDDRILVEHEGGLPGDGIVILETPKRIPVFIAGSIDNSFDIDPVPLLPVVDCALSAYKKSAIYERALVQSCDPTPVVTGINDGDGVRGQILEQGIGSGAFWTLPMGAQYGFMETDGVGIPLIEKAIEAEHARARELSVRVLNEGQGVEAAESVRMRMHTQHASLFSIVRSCQAALAEALALMFRWNNRPAADMTYEYSIDIANPIASEAIGRLIDSSINSGNMPPRLMYTWAVSVGLFAGTYEEFQREIEMGNSGAVA